MKNQMMELVDELDDLLDILLDEDGDLLYQADETKRVLGNVIKELKYVSKNQNMLTISHIAARSWLPLLDYCIEHKIGYRMFVEDFCMPENPLMKVKLEDRRTTFEAFTPSFEHIENLVEIRKQVEISPPPTNLPLPLGEE